MDVIKKIIREFFRGRVGLFLRQKLDVYPPAISLTYTEISSDLFIWRDPAVWDTFFNITHLGPILNPEYQSDYSVLILFNDANGVVLGQSELILKYGETALIDIFELSKGRIKMGEDGTFSIFHLADTKELFGDVRVCIAERGFVSYKKKNDQSHLRSYAHGNMNAVAYSSITKKSRCLGVFQKQKQFYRHQLSLGDAASVEIAIVNFLSVESKISIFEYKNNSRKHLKDIIIPSGGLRLLQSNTDFDLHSFVEFESNINFLRPVIFKHYENHFDVLHG